MKYQDAKSKSSRKNLEKVSLKKQLETLTNQLEVSKDEYKKGNKPGYLDSPQEIQDKIDTINKRLKKLGEGVSMKTTNRLKQIIKYALNEDYVKLNEIVKAEMQRRLKKYIRENRINYLNSDGQELFYEATTPEEPEDDEIFDDEEGGVDDMVDENEEYYDEEDYECDCGDEDCEICSGRLKLEACKSKKKMDEEDDSDMEDDTEEDDSSDEEDDSEEDTSDDEEDTSKKDKMARLRAMRGKK